MIKPIRTNYTITNQKTMNNFLSYYFTELSKNPRIQFWFAVVFDYVARISEKRVIPRVMTDCVFPKIVFFFRAFHCFFHGLLLEPFCTPWTQIISVSLDSTAEAYIENYAITADSAFRLLHKDDFKPCECFVYAKRADGKIVCRRMMLSIFMHPKTWKIYYDDSEEKSNIETMELCAVAKRPILSVVYRDPNEKTNTIVFDIETELYQVGNEILSKEFVARYLRYHCSSLSGYTDAYRLEIMDKDLKFVEIGAGESIILTTDGYEIIKT